MNSAGVPPPTGPETVGLATDAEKRSGGVVGGAGRRTPVVPACAVAVAAATSTKRMVAAAAAAAITRRQLEVIRLALIAGTFHDGPGDAAWVECPQNVTPFSRQVNSYSYESSYEILAWRKCSYQGHQHHQPFTCQNAPGPCARRGRPSGRGVSPRAAGRPSRRRARRSPRRADPARLLVCLHRKLVAEARAARDRGSR